MSQENLKEKYKEIFENLENYTLVRKPWGLMIFDIPRQGWLNVEYDDVQLKELLIKENIRIVDDVKDVKIPGFVHRSQVWDEDQQKMLMLSHQEAAEYFRKKKEAKKKKK